MSYKTSTYYGYRIDSNLSDVIDKPAALKQLGLNVKDLDIIREAASTDGATREDLVAVSDLDVPLYQTLHRYIGETNMYQRILDDTAGVDVVLRGDLQVNGGIGGSAIRYKFLNHKRRLNYSSITGALILNERLTDSADTNTTGIVKEIGSNYVIIGDITGGPFVNGRTFTSSYSNRSFVLTSSSFTTEVKYADISTSRISAWSTSSAGTPTAADPIFYGGQLKIVNGGKVSVDKIMWGQTAIERLKRPNGTYITGEIPTHTITANINGQNVKLYVMKSIPLKLRGFFKRFDGRVDFVSAVPNSRVSWRIVNTNDSNDTQTYTELGTTSRSTLPYRAINAAERDIEIYYHPDYITQLHFNNIGITELPSSQLPALTHLYVNNNSIKDMPDVKSLAPNLHTLEINRNSLYLATNESLRKLTKSVADKLPSSLTSLNMSSTFFGSIRCVDANNNPITTGIGGASSYSVIEKACPNLLTFNVSRNPDISPVYFTQDDYDTNANLPSMPVSLTSYSADYNDFRSVPTRGVKDLPNLVNFSVYDNYSLSDPSFSLSSNALVNVNIGSTFLPIPNLALKPNLTTFYANWNRNTSTTLFTDNNVDTSYKFSGCGSLEVLSLYGSRVQGFLPKFKNNSKLRHVDLYACQSITGGRPDNGEHGYTDGKTYVLYKDTFQDTPNIEFFRVLSYNLLVGKGFEPDTFKNLGSLSYLFWYSYGRTGSGAEISLPDISSCPKLQYFIMPVNNFTGPIPSMVSNNIIFYIDLSNNRLTGPVPTFSNRLSLRYLFLHNNNISQLLGFEGTPNLEYVYLQNNQITGAIPILGAPEAAPRISRFYAFNNQFTSYTPGAFTGLTRLQALDISKNNLTAFDINNIIDDLYINYITAPRSGVNVNVRNQTNAPGYVPSAVGSDKEQDIAKKIDFLRANGWTITIG